MNRQTDIYPPKKQIWFTSPLFTPLDKPNSVFLYDRHLNLESSHSIESSAIITAVKLNDYSIKESDNSTLRRFYKNTLYQNFSQIINK